jgi:hypothetical protein
VIFERLLAGTPEVHILSDHQPDASFAPVSPGLEDVYFTHLISSTNTGLRQN